MSTLYFSGIEKASTAQVLCCTQAAGMMSQLLYSPALLAACEDILLMIDSGAFTKTLTRRDIEKYAALIRLLDTRCVKYVNADVVGSQEKSNENYDFLLSLLPEHLHARILWVYQQSGDISYLYEGLEKYPYVGIGGLVPLLQEDKRKALKRIEFLAKIVQEYQRKAHYFGMTALSILELLHSYHEDFSVDSTTWLAGGKYGVLINAEGRQRSAAEGGYNFSTFAILEQNVRTMRAWVEGSPIKKKKSMPYTQLSLLENAG